MLEDRDRWHPRVRILWFGNHPEIATIAHQEERRHPLDQRSRAPKP
jgi:hypothetical protein